MPSFSWDKRCKITLRCSSTPPRSSSLSSQRSSSSSSGFISSGSWNKSHKHQLKDVPIQTVSKKDFLLYCNSPCMIPEINQIQVSLEHRGTNSWTEGWCPECHDMAVICNCPKAFPWVSSHQLKANSSSPNHHRKHKGPCPHAEPITWQTVQYHTESHNGLGWNGSSRIIELQPPCCMSESIPRMLCCSTTKKIRELKTSMESDNTGHATTTDSDIH